MIGKKLIESHTKSCRLAVKDNIQVKGKTKLKANERVNKHMIICVADKPNNIYDINDMMY